LKEMRVGLDLKCSLQAIHVVLDKMGLTLKKRRLEPANKIVPTSRVRGARGGAAKAASTRRGLSSSTNRGPKRT
jgi:transposase